MSITIINYDSNKIIAKFSGEIDESNADYVRCQLDELIDSHNNLNIILGISNLDFLDSTGIGILLGRYKKSKNKNINIIIKNPSKHVDSILNTCGIYTIMQKIGWGYIWKTNYLWELKHHLLMRVL